MNIFLIGMMASGKSVVGQLTAKKLGWAFCDSDELIEKEEKTTIAEIFEKNGEKAFRKIEKGMILRLSEKEGAVIATGGGAPCFKENWESFSKNGCVIWLKASAEELFSRLKKEPPGKRPLLKGNLMSLERISKILSARDPFYRAAEFHIETEGRSPDDLAEEIVNYLKRNRKIVFKETHGE